MPLKDLRNIESLISSCTDNIYNTIKEACPSD